eukprot:TRINITY_DN25074_c0_g1_i1.p1 TRINITY_DN25074_c0_g1~~TRINITY_DN25074_c0_g1_i1.p1  ORF type:complete len:225 (+),score=53.48 TRINITY_DN25074_c0_g1_i1:46-720(+)
MGRNRKGGTNRKQINRETKLRIQFDERARKDFLTGFRKRKDERRKKAKEQIEKRLKEEIKKIRTDTRDKLQNSKKSKAHQIVPEIAHLIDTDQSETNVTDFGSHSVTVTTLDSLEKINNPWKSDNKNSESDGEDGTDEDVASDEELPGMSLKPSRKKDPELVNVVDNKEKKAINRAAVKQLQSSKAFKANQKIKSKKQSKEARFGRKKLKKKRDRLHNPKKNVS